MVYREYIPLKTERGEFNSHCRHFYIIVSLILTMIPPTMTDSQLVIVIVTAITLIGFFMYICNKKGWIEDDDKRMYPRFFYDSSWDHIDIW